MTLNKLLITVYKEKKGIRRLEDILVEMLGRDGRRPCYITLELADKVVLDPYDIEKFLLLSYLLDPNGALGYQDEAKKIVKALEQTEKLDLELRQEIKARIDTYEKYLIETYIIRGGTYEKI